MDGLSDRVAVVTGGSKGIGRATAARLAEEGATVVIGDVDEDAGEEALEVIGSIGGDAAFVHVDVTKPDEVESMVDTAVEQFGGLDIAVNNAGILTPMVTVDEITEAHWARLLDINLTGIWHSMRYELPVMEEHGGSIVNVTSVAGLVGMPTLGSYSASKHGVVGLTRTAALEYAPVGVRVNAIAPGPTRTGIKPLDGDERGERIMSLLPDHAAEGKGVSGRLLNWLSGGTVDRLARTPMDRLAEPEEIASAIAFLASEEASFITGQVLPVDGGQTAD